MAITLLRICAYVEKSISWTIMENEDLLYVYRCDLSKYHNSGAPSGSEEYKNPETTLTVMERMQRLGTKIMRRNLMYIN